MKASSESYERDNGFTLIELLVVILVIGILSSIAVPAFLNQRKSAVDATVQTDVVNASTAVATWGVKNKGIAQGLPEKTDSLAKDIDISEGNVVTIRGNTNDYCIKGENSGGDTSNDTKGIVFSSIEGGLNKTATCDDTFVPSTNPNINDILVLGNPVADSNKPVTAEPAGLNNITCEDVSLISTEKTFITCSKKADSNTVQTNLLVSVGTTEANPVKWDVDVDAVKATNGKSFKSIVVDSSTATGNLKFTEPIFNVIGKDESWNSAPLHPSNRTYVTATKTISFTIRLERK